ncbi:precorrin-3B synthase [Ancylobacter oerskovii]|uniref:Precorrin-3B synthase n=1 Tax=Ancylobacter oerskovii TaxID=459519 RepID=A0ABW4YRI8_9HYPH|nr:precorrin-3B synthase [Ancylobacter oerskovii]MBS7545608.1 precorrin-3B synthase [Ancylobacter oerskovii]
MSGAAGNAAAFRRGACPTLPAPMATGDGLLARLALAGPLTPPQAAGLAALARDCGNGIIEVTARGKLQLRGLDAVGAARLAEGVGALGLALREGLGIETSALAGRDPAEAFDPRPLAAAIAQAAQVAGLADRLAPKVSVGIDGGGALGLAGRDLDIAVSPAAAGFRIAAAGVAIGRTPAPGPVVLALLERLAALGPQARMRDLLAAEGAAALGAGLVPAEGRVPSPGEPVGRHALAEGRHGAGRCALGLALPFGQIEAEGLQALAGRAAELGADFIEPAGGRALVIGPLDEARADALAQAAGAAGLIVDAADPLRRIAACPGAPACGSARFATRALARQLVRGLAGGRTVHVSGCVKGCAHPGRADLTIVGLDEGAGIVVEGTPRDAPVRIVPFDAAAGVVRAFLESELG